MRLCFDCLCLIPLFRDVLLFVHGLTDSSARFLMNIGDWRIIAWELGSLGRDHLPNYATLSFSWDGWQIKGLETVVMPRWANDDLSLLCVRVRGTPVGVIAPVKAEILVIGELFISRRTSDWVTSLLRPVCRLAVCSAAWIIFLGVDRQF